MVVVVGVHELMAEGAAFLEIQHGLIDNDEVLGFIVEGWELAFTLLDKLDSLSRRAIFQSFQTLLRSKKREKVRRFFLNLTFSRRKSGRRGPLMIANMQNSN